MKPLELFDELSSLAKNLGISIRKEKGNFKSGICTVKDEIIVVLNKTASVEVMNSIMAVCLFPHLDNLFIKPVLRDFIEKESRNIPPGKFQLEVNELLTETIEIIQKNKKK